MQTRNTAVEPGGFLTFGSRLNSAGEDRSPEFKVWPPGQAMTLVTESKRTLFASGIACSQ
jgi:hypothetical protein